MKNEELLTDLFFCFLSGIDASSERLPSKISPFGSCVPNEGYPQGGVSDPPKIAVEIGVTDIWYKYASKVVGFDNFGHSGAHDTIMNSLGFTPENIARTMLDAIKGK